MADVENPIIRALNNRGIAAPEYPLDISEAFRAAGVKRKYLICITGRCGSTWLARTLEQLPYCGRPLEYFSEEAIPYYGRPDGSGGLLQYVQSLAEERQTSGAFGLKIDGMRLGWFSQICDLSRSFNPESTAWVDMRRLNLIKQAFSFARAKTSGVWHVYDDGSSAAAPTHFGSSRSTMPDALVWRELLSIIRNERAMDRIYMQVGVVPLRIVYEELLDSKRQILQRLLTHFFPRRALKVSDFEIQERTQKLAGEVENEEEISFLERNAALVNSAYSLRFHADTDISELEMAVKQQVVDL